jgi:hypothetical protein
MPNALTMRLPWTLSCNSAVRLPVLICPRLVNRLIFLLMRITGRTEAGNTKNAIEAKTQSW